MLGERPLTGLLGLLMLASAVNASVVTLTDLNATARFDLTPGNNVGNYDWEVNAIDHMFQQWFYIKVADGPVIAIDELALAPGGSMNYSTLDFDPNPGDEYLFVWYQDPASVRVDVGFELAGSLTKLASDLGETITVKNVSGGPLSISFFELADFDLDGTIPDLSVSLDPPPPAGLALQTGDLAAVSETTIPGEDPDNWDAGLYATVTANIAAGNLTGTTGLMGPADLSWAFQWDRTLAAGDRLIISKDKHIIPEPSTLSLLALGVLAATRQRRRLTAK